MGTRSAVWGVRNFTHVGFRAGLPEGLIWTNWDVLINVRGLVGMSILRESVLVYNTVYSHLVSKHALLELNQVPLHILRGRWLD